MQTTTYSIKDTDLVLDGKNNKDVKSYILKIRDLPAEDKPREKLMTHGASILSAKELLAIVLNTGTKKEGVLEMVSRVINEYGEKVLVKEQDPEKLAEILEIPLVKATQIIACFELGRRFFEKGSGAAPVLRTARDVYEYLADMRKLPKEHLRGLYIDAHYRLLRDEAISIGTVNSNLVHPREVFRPAMECGAVAVILAHNHPSGILQPSDADISITEQIIESGKIVGIHLVDHLIISPDGFKSINIKYD